MKLAKVGDMHLGVRSGDPNFLAFQKAWLEYFFEECKARGIFHVIQVGDMFDVRQHMKLNIMHFIITWFIPKVKEYGLQWWIIPGNHDIFYREDNSIHSLQLLDAICPENFHIIEDVEPAVFGDTEILFVPWMNKKNTEDFLAKIEKSNAEYMIGHLELKDFPMYKGVPATHGMDHKLFSKFKKVFSGHYHTISEHQNILYLGTPYHLTWSDVSDGNNRGFWTFDTKTTDHELVKNKDYMTMFSVIEYDPEATYDEKSLEAYEGNIVKVLVNEKPDTKHYKKFTGLLSKAKFIDYNIIDSTVIQLEKVEVKEEVLRMDTLGALTSYIEKQDNDAIDKDAVKNLATEYFKEAVNV